MSQLQGAHPNQVVHVRGDSESEMEALFAVNNPGATTNQQVPFRMRKLPASFFTPPDPTKGQHSREGSSDSSGFNSIGSPISPPNVNNLAIVHPRANSSPASLQQTLRAPMTPPNHARQHSYDALEETVPLPLGWEMAKTPDGHRYYLNHLDQSTTWQDPRKSQMSHTQHSSPPPIHQAHPLQQHQPIPGTHINSLPPGWEHASTLEGEIYYINHNERTTSWVDPRNLQLQAHHPLNMRIAPLNISQPGQGTGLGGMLPTQQQQPSPGQGQTTPGQGQRGQMSPNERERQMQLQKLHMEKERLRKRQEEISRQEMMVKQQMNKLILSPQPDINLLQQQINEANADISAISQSNEMTSMTDPFLGQGNPIDVHVRQESTDSGLGGMGSYTLSRTPEDLLGNVDEMDTQDGGHKLSTTPDISSMDIGDVTDTAQMDGDDLVPSLQEDISSDLLNDVESVLGTPNRMDSLLTWL